jgi:hypothetical protein
MVKEKWQTQTFFSRRPSGMPIPTESDQTYRGKPKPSFRRDQITTESDQTTYGERRMANPNLHFEEIPLTTKIIKLTVEKKNNKPSNLHFE